MVMPWNRLERAQAAGVQGVRRRGKACSAGTLGRKADSGVPAVGQTRDTGAKLSSAQDTENFDSTAFGRKQS